MTATGYKVFGIAMQRRGARRKLVVVTYGALVAFCTTTFVLHVAYGLGALLPYSWSIYASMAVSMFVFGGNGRWGLVKSFANKPPQPDAPMVEIVKLNLAPRTLVSQNTSMWKNDERELSRRDQAHYHAYQAVAVAVLVILLLAFWSIKPPLWVSAEILREAVFIVALLTSVLALTLPAAIILWTEPDIDTPEEQT
jgi:hypothetical protein